MTHLAKNLKSFYSAEQTRDVGIKVRFTGDLYNRFFVVYSYCFPGILRSTLYALEVDPTHGLTLLAGDIKIRLSVFKCLMVFRAITVSTSEG